MKKLIIILFSAILVNCALADDSKISDQVEKLINKTDADLNIGIKIKNLATGEVVYECAKESA